MSWKTFKLLYRTFIRDNVYRILSESAGFCGRYDKTFCCVFSVHSVYVHLVCVKDADTVLWLRVFCSVLFFLPSFFLLLLFIVPLSTKICAHFIPWKQARSNWNFNTMCRMFSVRGRLLFRQVLGHRILLATANIRYNSKLFIALSLAARPRRYNITASTFAALWALMCCFGAEIPAPSTQTANSFSFETLYNQAI